MKKIILLFAVSCVFLMSSCATIFSGTKCKVKVKDGSPVSAKVYVNGSYEGTAPCKIKISKNSLKAGATVEIKADGYETQKVTLVRKMKMGALVGDIVTGIVWLAIDFADGAIYRAYPNKIEYNLVLDSDSKANDIKFNTGDIVYFSNDEYKNQEGVVKIAYPNKIVITVQKKNGKQIEVEVPYMNVSKK
jgi:transcription antitermination factor NusG